MVEFRHDYTTCLIDVGKLRNISWPRFKKETYCRQYSRAVTESELARSRPRYVQMKFPFIVPELRGPSFTVNGMHVVERHCQWLILYNIGDECMDGWVDMKQVFVLLWSVLRGTAILRVV